MPTVFGNRWRHLRAEMDLTSDEAAGLLNIAGGALRQIEVGTKPASLALAYRAARLFKCPVGDLVDTGEGVPDEPPRKPRKNPQPKQGRKDKEGTGPKRAHDSASAA